MSSILDPGRILTDVALLAAAGAAVLLVGYLVRRPLLGGSTKLWLFAGLGPLPIMAAMIGNVASFEGTKDRSFCARCHTMDLYADDAADPNSKSLAALHSRSPMFGGQSCYICHADYGMFGMPLTKLGGMRHVWYYYTDNWEAPGHRPPKLLKPYSHEACKQCHLPGGPRQPLEHQVHLQAILSNEVGCTAAGCHGRPHPVNPATIQTPVGAASERAP